MLGHIVLTEERGSRPVQEREEVLGLSVCRVTVPAPASLNGWRLNRRLEKAARMLEQAGIRRVLAAPGFPGWPRLSARGILGVETAPFCQAMAAPLVLAALERRGTAPERAVVALRGNRVTRSFFQAAEALCPRVRALTVCAPSGGEALATYLRREYGVAVLERGTADLTVCFSQEEGGMEGALMLCSSWPELLNLSITLKDAALPACFEPLPLLAALWEEGRITPDQLAVY